MCACRRSEGCWLQGPKPRSHRAAVKVRFGWFLVFARSVDEALQGRRLLREAALHRRAWPGRFPHRCAVVKATKPSAGARSGRGSGEVRPCGWWRLRPHLLPTASTFRRDPRKTPTTIHKHCSAGHERGGPRAPGGEPEASEPPGHTETARQDMRTSLNTVHLMAKQLDKQSQDGRSQLHWFRAFVLPCIRCDPWKATNTSIVLGSVR